MNRVLVAAVIGFSLLSEGRGQPLSAQSAEPAVTLSNTSLVGVRESAVVAQTTAAPSVAVRRNAALNGPVLAGDFNGDGIVDLVAQDPRSAGSSILIALGKGDSTFGAPIRSSVAGIPLAVGDFNKDGKADLLVHPRVE